MLPKLRRRAGRPMDLVGAGVVLGTGGAVVERLPSSAATSGINAGLNTAASFIPVMVNVGMGGYIINQARNLRRPNGKRRFI